MDQLKELLPLLVRRLNDRETDSSSSDDELDLHILKQFRPIQNLNDRTGDYMQIVDQYSDSEFKEQFRVSRQTFELLIEILKKDLAGACGEKGSKMISPRQQVLITLSKMTSMDSYGLLCRQFNVGRATACRAVERVTHALFLRASQFITWPSYPNRLKVMKEFQAISGLPHIIGVIDDLHIRIPKPLHNSKDYVNEKGDYSMHLQLVCDHNSLITHCATGEPGSLTHRTVFQKSGMENFINDNSKFPGEALLIGDDAYELHPRLMTPFPSGSLTERQANYNKHHSVAHQVVVRCFQLLKGRMRSLLETLPITRVKLIPEYIVACCVIHNICIMQGDTINIENLPPIEKPNLPVVYKQSCSVGSNKRNWIMNSLKKKDLTK